MITPSPMSSAERLSTSAGCIVSGAIVSDISFADDQVGGSQSVGLQSDQSGVPDNGAGDDSLVGFFAIGVVINIALVAAYFIWAYRQWKRKK